MRDLAPRTRDSPTAEELADRSLRRLARGGTSEGVAREIAWKAAQATGADAACLDWLPELVDAALAERAEGLEFTLDPEQPSAREEHLREWPRDLPGAEIAAALAAHEDAARRAGLAYVDVLDWAIGVLEDRLAQAPPPRRRLRPLRQQPEPDAELPPLVAESLVGDPPRYGWPTRRDRPRPRAA